MSDRFFDDLRRCSREERRRLLGTSLARDFREDGRGASVDVNRILVEAVFVPEVYDER
jgi:hypothetical protein